MNQHPKCIWTGNSDARVKAITLETLDRFSVSVEKTFYVLPEYEQELRGFNERFIEWGRKFLLLIIWLTVLLPVSVLIAIISSTSDSIILYTVGIITSIIGIVIVLFPFATPETVKRMG